MNVLDFQTCKARGEKIVMLTCYDYTSARIVQDSDVDVILVGDSAATVREAGGLAMSSRNQHLDVGNRMKAASLYAALKQSRTAIEARQTLAGQGFDVDYVEDIAGRRLAAVRLGDTRLIDNVEI